MNSERIKEIQETTAYPNSNSVRQALCQVWNECKQEYALMANSIIKDHQDRIKELEKQESVHWRQGSLAKELNLDCEDNPHSTFSATRHRDWDMGWHGVTEEDLINDN